MAQRLPDGCGGTAERQSVWAGPHGEWSHQQYASNDGSMLLDYIAILTDANAAQNDDLTLNLTVTDENEQFYVTRKNGVLLSYPGENHPDAQASVTCKRLQLFALMTGQQAGQVQISGDPTVLKRLLAYASKFEKTFNVIEP